MRCLQRAEGRKPPAQSRSTSIRHTPLLLASSMVLLGGCASAPQPVTSAEPKASWGTISGRFDPDENAIRVRYVILDVDDDSVFFAYDELRNGEGTLTVDGEVSPFLGASPFAHGVCSRKPAVEARVETPVDDGSRLWRHSDREWESVFPVASPEALERLRSGGRLVINPRAVWRFNTLSHASFAW